MQTRLSDQPQRHRRYTRPKGVMIRALIDPCDEEQIREMAIRESRTMSAMIALLLAGAVRNKQGQA
jgi:hypothetical protein